MIDWGILGCGRIAADFAAGLQILPEARLAAVGSRSGAKAEEFGRRFGAPRRHASYAALADDPGVDVVYIATPHTLHAENALLCLRAGKAVLCEKPFTINATEAEKVIAAARERRLFLMEAMWTRFFPAMQKLRSMLDGGAIGEPGLLHADFGFRCSIDPHGRLYDLQLGGGALLDVGVYCVSLASMCFGTPAEVYGAARIGETGVDEQSVMTLRYAGGQMAVLSCAIRAETPQEAWIAGTEGRIRVHSPWWKPSRLTLTRAGDRDTDILAPFEGNGMGYEAAEVMRCLSAGALESPIMPLDESVQIMRTMDTLRARWGLVYPGD